MVEVTTYRLIVQKRFLEKIHVGYCTFKIHKEGITLWIWYFFNQLLTNQLRIIQPVKMDINNPCSKGKCSFMCFRTSVLKWEISPTYIAFLSNLPIFTVLIQEKTKLMVLASWSESIIWNKKRTNQLAWKDCLFGEVGAYSSLLHIQHSTVLELTFQPICL